jgi:hypothetical protein
MLTKILATVFYLLLFNFLIYRYKIFQFRSYRPFITHLIFNLKFVAGIFIWLIYTFYYKDVQNNDVHKFYKDALVLRDAASENPKAFAQVMIYDDGEEAAITSPMKNWNRNFDEAPFNENRAIIRLNALMMFISFKTYLVHVLFFCFISLLGWILLTNAVFSLVDARNAIVALPVLLLPSVLFWTSGVMKEPLLILGLGLYISSMARGQWSIVNILKLIIGADIILFTKFFVLACLLPAATAFFLFRKREERKFILMKYVLVSFVFVLLSFNINRLVPRINPVQMLANKQAHALKEASYFKAGSKIEIPEIDNSPVSMLKAAGVGTWNTIMRPYIWEAKNIMMLASAVENVFVITWLLMCISSTNWKKMQNLNLALFLLTFSLGYFAIVGMATPVLGNLVRYKAPLLPLLMFAFIVVMNPRAVANSLGFVLRREAK